MAESEVVDQNERLRSGESEEGIQARGAEKEEDKEGLRVGSQLACRLLRVERRDSRSPLLR